MAKLQRHIHHFTSQRITSPENIISSENIIDYVHQQNTFIYSQIKFSFISFSEKVKEIWNKRLTQKQPPRCVIKKMCSENMQQIYRRRPMQYCDFNKVAKQLYWNCTSAWVFSCKFAAYFQNTFSYKHLWVAASVD